ncbi:MAG: glucose 1-dehydrogenase [Phycisphaeraceae bacterium]
MSHHDTPASTTPTLDPARAFSLAGEVALITGGGSGLGLGMARCLAAAGATVALVGRRESVLAAAAKQIGPAASAFAHDITRFEDSPALVERIGEVLGPVTVLINNAGVHLKKPAVQTSEREFQTLLDTHVLAASALTRAVAPSMVHRRHGSILFTASMTALIGMPQVLAYSAVKSACVGMVRSLAAELSPHDVRVNAIAPGWIQSEMLEQALAGDEPRKQKILARTPMGRFGEPEDIGWTAAWLCSPAARFITGVLLPVDGGAAIAL